MSIMQLPAVFRYFLVVRLCTTLAYQIQSVAIGWLVYDLTKSPISLGLIGLCTVLPYLSISLFGGYIADRVHRKRIIILSLLSAMLCHLVLFFYIMSAADIKHLKLFPIYLFVFNIGIIRAFNSPALFAYLSQIVDRDQYVVAATWNSNVFHLSSIAGPALSGLLYGYLGAIWSFGITAALYTFAILLALFLPYKPLVMTVKEDMFSAIRQGIQFVKQQQVILGALSLDMFAVFFGGAVALLPMFADQVLNIGPQGLGWLRSAPALGALVMASLLGKVSLLQRAGYKLLWAIAGFGMCIIAFALSRNFYLSFFLLFLSGAFDNISVVVRQTILQLMTPDEMRGRVSAINGIFIGSSNELGEFESGIAAKLLGLIPSVIFGGCMTILTTGIVGKYLPQLRNLDLQKAAAVTPKAS